MCTAFGGNYQKERTGFFAQIGSSGVLCNFSNLFRLKMSLLESVLCLKIKYRNICNKNIDIYQYCDDIVRLSIGAFTNYLDNIFLNSFQ